MKNIIFVTGLTLWSMGKSCGGPAFTKTVRKYIDEGWNVYLISDVPENAECPWLDREHNLQIKPSPFKRFGGIRKLGLLFRWLDHLYASYRFRKILEKVLSGLSGETLLYAYEIFGVKACARLGIKYSLPVVSRFQGTILCKYENTLLNRIKRYPHFQALSEKTELIIMTDDGTQGERVLRELGNDSKRLFLRNGLDLMAKDREKMRGDFEREGFRALLGVKPGELMLLTVSRLVPWKKVGRAIEGLASSREAGGKMKLVIVGDGEDKARLQNFASSLNVSDSVVFTGAVPHDAVYDYMMACDMFLSLYDLSNVGNPLLEAMALQCCVVTLDVGDTNRVIVNEENGILIKYEQLPELGAVLDKLARFPKFRQTLGKRAEIYANRNFYSWDERMSIEYAEISKIIDVQ